MKSLLAALLLAATPAVAECRRDAAPCPVAMGTYHVALPDMPAPEAGRPGILFLHGAGGTGRGVLGMTGTVQALTDRGYVVLAPDGLPWREDRAGGIWSFLPPGQRPRRRDEAAFLAEVVADAAERHEVDPNRVILSGFSAGGFMVNYLACETPGAFPAYAPVSGGFWQPHPETCDGPVNLFHTHGWRDATVPLEGRPLGGGRFLQGDIFAGLDIWRQANGCAAPAPNGYGETGQFLRRRWDCGPGAALELALFPGGHGVPSGWADMMLDWFEGLDG